MLSEDEALLRLDRELDIRLSILQGNGPKPLVNPHKGHTTEDEFTEPGSSESHCDNLSSIPNVGVKPKNDLLMPSKNEFMCRNSENTHNTGKTENDAKNNKYEVSAEDVDLDNRSDDTDGKSVVKDGINVISEDSEELEEAKDAIFDEFLDQSTQIRIKSLTSKVASLTQALNVLQAECRKLAQAKQEATAAAHTAEMSKRSISKQLHTCQLEAARHQKSNKHLQERTKELTSECQTLRKDLSSSRQSENEYKNSLSSSHAQLHRSRAENAALKEQIANMKMKHKDELEDFSRTIAESNALNKELERQQRNYCALVKKQEHLIRVLNEQKANIGVAKAAACLEDKFLAVITPLQPP